MTLVNTAGLKKFLIMTIINLFSLLNLEASIVNFRLAFGNQTHYGTVAALFHDFLSSGKQAEQFQIEPGLFCTKYSTCLGIIT